MRMALAGSVMALLMVAGWARAQCPPDGTPCGLAPFWPAEPFRAPGNTVDADSDVVCGQGPCIPAPKLKASEPALPACPTNFWFSAEYLHWAVKRAPAPVPLVTTSAIPPDALPAPQPGALGGPSTTVLFGGGTVDYHQLSGGRFSLGLWDDDHTSALEARAFLLERHTNTFNATSSDAGVPTLFLPFFNLNGTVETAVLLANPGLVAGRVIIPTSSRVRGGDANVDYVPYAGTAWRWTLLAGFRYLDLEERLDIAATRQAIDGGTVAFGGATFAAPARTVSLDQFRTHNQFYGGQIGTRAEYQFGRFFLDAEVKVAFGADQQTQDINGLSTLIVPGSIPSSLPGGVFALPVNSGTFSHYQFAVVPEVEVKLGMQVFSSLSAFVGYDFLSCSRVLRPADQIDRELDSREIPTSPAFVPGFSAARPAVQFRESNFWAQGIEVGLEFLF